MEHPLMGVNGTKEPVPGVLYPRQSERALARCENDVSRTVISLAIHSALRFVCDQFRGNQF
jgi:hypothetical protein